MRLKVSLELGDDGSKVTVGVKRIPVILIELEGDSDELLVYYAKALDLIKGEVRRSNE